MRNITKYRGIIPAFYACYDEKGRISPERVDQLTELLIQKGVKGLYVGGSSGECIYQSVGERKLVLEHVVAAAEGRITVIAHVACNNTADSCELAAHAASLGVDAIAAIPPIYFKLSDDAIAAYWNDISAAAPDTDFVIYNIPQLAGVSLTVPLFRMMRENPRLAAVKSSSLSVQDIQIFKAEGGRDFTVFNGADEQLVAGLAIGADGGIGGTYAVMPELYLEIFDLMHIGEVAKARMIQDEVNAIIAEIGSCRGHLYAVAKEIIRIRDGLTLGGVRRPLPPLTSEDAVKAEKIADHIDSAVSKFLQN